MREKGVKGDEAGAMTEDFKLSRASRRLDEDYKRLNNDSKTRTIQTECEMRQHNTKLPISAASRVLAAMTAISLGNLVHMPRNCLGSQSVERGLERERSLAPLRSTGTRRRSVRPRRECDPDKVRETFGIICGARRRLLPVLPEASATPLPSPLPLHTV